jgi:hypothetical protein
MALDGLYRRLYEMQFHEQALLAGDGGRVAVEVRPSAETTVR